jgi:hypothetical protein
MMSCSLSSCSLSTPHPNVINEAKQAGWPAAWFTVLFSLGSLVGSTPLLGQTITNTSTAGTSTYADNPNGVQDDFIGNASVFLYTPASDQYLTSFAYLGTDGVTKLAAGNLYWGITTYGTAGNVPDENGFSDNVSPLSSTISEGAWNFASGTVLLSANTTYTFMLQDSPLDTVGVTENGDGNPSYTDNNDRVDNNGAAWVFYMYAGRGEF